MPFAFPSLGPEQTALREKVLFGFMVSKPPGYGGRKDREGLTGWSQEGLLGSPFILSGPLATVWSHLHSGWLFPAC